MSQTSKIAIFAGCVLAAMVLLWVSRPIILVTKATPLWGSEFDASRQGTSIPATGTPLRQLNTGETLRVVWTMDGKDYRAYLVIGSDWTKGWVLYGQDGVVPPAG